ncbi:replication initiation protein [Aliarcobacter cryaerophilus]|uniref:replication initiation protein n=1 Tax=Aliarcobacter cryaerophilus TaxID=28198 RepID=UPI0011E04338|nr:replication initiation protein [Aliarcobacter cryaerophilus]
MEQELKKEDYKVVKHNDLVNEKPKDPYTLNQLKLICHLISHIKPTDTNFETKEVSLKELNFDSIENGCNYGIFKSEILELLKKPFQIPEDEGWTNWFSFLKYKEGVIEYAFDERLKQYLLNLKNNFTSYQLKNILSLKSVYAIRMYELLKQYEVAKARTIEIKELRSLLNISRGYKNNDITKLLENVKEELTLKTDLTFNFEVFKKQQKLNEVKFTIQHNNSERTNKVCKKKENKNLSVKEKLKSLKI